MDTKSPLNIASYKGPKYRRLFNALDSAIRSGTMEAGRKLPPVRELAWQLGITPGTVARAYQMATDEGLLEATVGRGTFVKKSNRDLADIPSNFIARPYDDGSINFRNGHTIDLGQSEVIRQLSREIIESNDIDFAGYVRDDALSGCRNLASEWLHSFGIAGNASDIVLTNGAHNSVMVALNSILHGRDPAIATTELTYPGFRQTAHICRSRLLGVKSDDEGLLPDHLEYVCVKERPQVLLISSNVHNPTCTTTSFERREAIADLARRYDFQIIEDDVYGTLISDRPAGFDRICPERTWHATSLSKCFAAGLRIGFLQCPEGHGALGLRVMQGMSLSISQLLTRLVERLFETGTVQKFEPQIAQTNTARVQLSKSLLKKWNVRSKDGVNFLWVDIPEGWSGSAFMSACEAEGILVAVADKFTLPQKSAPNAVRLTVSQTKDEDELKTGIEQIDALLSRPPQGILT